MIKYAPLSTGVNEARGFEPNGVSISDVSDTQPLILARLRIEEAEHWEFGMIHANGILRARFRGVRGEDVEDAVADAVESVLRHPPEDGLDGSILSIVVYRATQRLLDNMRKAKVRSRTERNLGMIFGEDDREQISEDEPNDQAVETEPLLNLERDDFLRTLRPRMRQFASLAFKGASMEEIEASLRMSDVALRKMECRLFAKARHYFLRR